MAMETRTVVFLAIGAAALALWYAARRPREQTAAAAVEVS